jgi:hypothetical protein
MPIFRAASAGDGRGRHCQPRPTTPGDPACSYQRRLGRPQSDRPPQIVDQRLQQRYRQHFLSAANRRLNHPTLTRSRIHPPPSPLVACRSPSPSPSPCVDATPPRRDHRFFWAGTGLLPRLAVGRGSPVVASASDRAPRRLRSAAAGIRPARGRRVQISPSANGHPSRTASNRRCAPAIGDAAPTTAAPRASGRFA